MKNVKKVETTFTDEQIINALNTVIEKRNRIAMFYKQIELFGNYDPKPNEAKAMNATLFNVYTNEICFWINTLRGYNASESIASFTETINLIEKDILENYQPILDFNEKTKTVPKN